MPMPDHKTVFYEKLTREISRLTPSDRRIIDHLLRTYPNCLLKTATAISGEIGINVSTVTRFFNKIEYKKIVKEHTAGVDFMVSSPLDRLRESREKQDSAPPLHDHASVDMGNIQKTLGELDDALIKDVLELLSHGSRSVHIFSERSKTLAPAYYLFAQLELIRSNVRFLETDRFTIARAMLEVGSKDLLVLFEFRRYPVMNMDIAEAFKKRGGKLLAVTDSPLSPVGQIADRRLLVHTSGMSVFDSYTAAFSLINFFISELAEFYKAGFNDRYAGLEKLYSDLKVY